MNILFKRSVQRIILLAISFLIQVAIIIFFLLQYSEYFFNFYIASLALSIVIVFIITNSKSNPSYKIAWIIPVMIFPVFGGLFYLLYGGNKLSAREKLKMAIQNIEMTHSLKQNDKIMQISNLTVNLEEYTAMINQVKIPLTKKEIETMWILGQNPNKVFTRDNLLDSLWGFDYYGDSRTVDSHIKRLRAKIDKEEHPQWRIKTIWGVGYKFEIDE